MSNTNKTEKLDADADSHQKLDDSNEDKMMDLIVKRDNQSDKTAIDENKDNDINFRSKKNEKLRMVTKQIN